MKQRPRFSPSWEINRYFRLSGLVPVCRAGGIQKEEKMNDLVEGLCEDCQINYPAVMLYDHPDLEGKLICDSCLNDRENNGFEEKPND